MNKQLYFFDQDDSCHWYMIESSKRKEWDAWRNLPEDDENSWDVPEFAKSINSPYSIDFYLP